MACFFSVPAQRSFFPRLGVLLSSCSLFIAGCAGGENYETVTSEDADRAEAHADHDHHHHHEAPHGGHLIELGDHKYNAEVLLEGEPKQLVVYVLDAHAENPVAIEGESITFTPEEGEPITLVAHPQEGDAEGKASKFVAADTTLTDLEEVHGSVQATIDGTDYAGELSHDHDHGEHDHGEEAGEKHDHANDE
jgi:hypothetical protein